MFFFSDKNQSNNIDVFNSTSWSLDDLLKIEYNSKQILITFT